MSHLKNETISDGVYKNRVFVELIDCGKTETDKMVHEQNFQYNTNTGRIHLMSTMDFCLSVDKTGKSYGYKFTSKNRDRMSVDYCDYGFSQAIQFGRRSDWVIKTKSEESSKPSNETIGGRSMKQPTSIKNGNFGKNKNASRKNKSKKVKEEWSKRNNKNSAVTTVLG